MDSSNILNNDNILQKSFIETSHLNKEILSEHVLLSFGNSNSFNANNLINRKSFQKEYMGNIKYNAKTKNIPERESIAEESKNLTKEIMNYNLTQQTTIFNSIDRDNGSDFTLKNKKILVKHSLRKNKSPKFLHPKKKLSNKRNNQYVLSCSVERQSSFLGNTQTFNKYKYLFGDIENNRAESLCPNRRISSKKQSNIEDSDLTNMQRFGTIYSTIKTQRNNIHINGDFDKKRIFNSITNRANVLN